MMFFLGRSVSTVSLASCIHPRDNLGSRWWLRGTISKKIAEEIIGLIKEMTEVKFSFDCLLFESLTFLEHI